MFKSLIVPLSYWRWLPAAALAEFDRIRVSHVIAPVMAWLEARLAALTAPGFAILAPISLCIIAVSGCCTPVDTAIGIPPGPDLRPIEQEMWDEIPDHLKVILNENGLEWEKFYDKVTGRIRRHDEGLKH